MVVLISAQQVIRLRPLTPGDQHQTMPSIGIVVAILVLASSTSILSTEIYAPSLPYLDEYFDTTESRVKLTISLNMLAFGLAQLVHGPLSDRFGRRPVMLCSLVAVAVLSLACALSVTIEQLILVRILLGVAAAAEAVVGLAILKDLYEEQDQMRALALLGMVIAITPAVAPIIGGQVHVMLGWQANFVIIAVLALLSWAMVWRLLPETATVDTGALGIRRLWQDYSSLFSHQAFLVCSAMLGLTLGTIYIFVTLGPFVLIDLMQVPVEHYGFHQAIMVGTFFLGSFTASRLVDLWPADRLLLTGIGVIAAGAIVLLLLQLANLMTPLRLMGGFSIMTFGAGPVFAVLPSRALRDIRRRAGAAAALLSAIEQGVGGLAAVGMSLVIVRSPWPLVLGACLLAALLLAATGRLMSIRQ